MNAGIEANVLCKPRKNWPNLPLLTKMRTTGVEEPCAGKLAGTVLNWRQWRRTLARSKKGINLSDDL
jgi:hypothetical protein